MRGVACSITTVLTDAPMSVCYAAANNTNIKRDFRQLHLQHQRRELPVVKSDCKRVYVLERKK